jgi:hypothetical protein
MLTLFKSLKKKKIKIFLKIKGKNIINCKKLTSKIFYNLTYIYIKTNFLLINKLIKYNSFCKNIFKTNYNLLDSTIYNDSFILNYLDNNLNNKKKLMININKNKKPLSIILLLKKILFSNKKLFRFLKNEKAFLKINIYNIYFILFYHYMINSFSYNSFLKINNLKNKKLFFTSNLFLKKNLKRSFKFFFKNIIMFLYKFSLIKKKKKRFFSIFRKKKYIYKDFKISYLGKKNIVYFRKKGRFFSKRKKKYHKLKKNYKFYKKKKSKLKTKLNKKIRKKLKKKKNKKKNIFFRFKKYKKKKSKLKLKKKLKILKKLRILIKLKKKKILKQIKKSKKLNFFKKINKLKLTKKNKKKLNLKILLFLKRSIKKKLLKEKKKKKKKLNFFKKKILKLFKYSIKKKSKLYFFKKLFLKKTIVKRIYELSFKKDIKLRNATSILKNNKKFKFLTFPLNSVCKFFFKNSMYNIFMTLVVLPLNLTIGNFSGGHFNILSKRRDRGSINSLKSMAKLISLKIYQSNLSFIIFCPRLFTNRNKRLIKTIFYSFKILNRSPITKIYLYRPVIRNGIRSKKIPRK